MMPEVVVVDYGLGNLFSVCRALEHCGAKPLVCADPDVVARSERLILPGVGAFGEGMERLTRLGMADAVKEAATHGAHLLGICLGMQFLLSSSEEFGQTEGLGLIPGRVIAVPKRTTDGISLEIPHIGWNTLFPAEGRPSWLNTPLDRTSAGSAVYFVHSFMAVPDDSSHRLAECVYGDTRIAAVIGCGKIWGAQFHPEKSGEAGLNFLRRFIIRT